MTTFAKLLIGLVLLAGIASAGPGSDPVGAAREAGADGALDTFYGTAVSDITFDNRRVGFADDNRTIYFYYDDTGQRFGESMTLPPVYLHGNGTDHARFDSPAGIVFVELAATPGAPTAIGFAVGTERATLCPADGIATPDGARGLRCNGDVDGDGEGDFSEIADGSSPIGTRELALP